MSGRTWMIERRTLLVGAAACGLVQPRTAAAMGSEHAGVSSLPVPPSGAMGFRMMRHGSQIGSHTLEFNVTGDTLTVQIAADALVKFGPIPLVRYTHRNTEIWQNGRLARLEAHTDRNGTQMHMSAHRTSAGLNVEGSGTSPYVAPYDALATTYWNFQMMRVPMIGVQNGTLARPRITEKPVEEVRLASGAEASARCYNLSGDIDLDIWYNSDDNWMCMRFTVGDGSVITYERL